MASLASVVRITARTSAVWRECRGCTDLAPLSPAQTHCKSCRAKPRRVTSRRVPRAA